MLVVIPVESSSCKGGKIWNFIGKTVIKLCILHWSGLQKAYGSCSFPTDLPGYTWGTYDGILRTYRILQKSNSPRNKLHLLRKTWSTETSLLPKQFSFINIVEHAEKGQRNSQSYVEKPIEKGYKFFYENYLFGALCLLKGSEGNVKGKCYRSQRKSDRPHDLMVIYITNWKCKQS